MRVCWWKLESGRRAAQLKVAAPARAPWCVARSHGASLPGDEETAVPAYHAWLANIFRLRHE